MAVDAVGSTNDDDRWGCTPVIFLDIDGVLNGHDYNPVSQSNPIWPEKIMLLNHILQKTGAKIVICSAWRYMVHGGAITLTGFEYLLRTHGLMAGRIIGATCSDESDHQTRGRQIADFRHRYIPSRARCVVIDDGDDCDDESFRLSSCGIPWVQPHPKFGLSVDNAITATQILWGRQR